MSGLLRRLRDVLRPDFRVESELASGGMARVFLARDASLDRRVAVKVLRPELATAAGARRFLREARLLARVAHPNVVTVHEVGERGGLFYCVLDWIDGETLEERLAEGPLGTSAALELGDDLLSALGAAHAQGVVHRDVKPANLVLGAGVGAVLVDFGVAKAVTGTGEAGHARSDGLTAPDARPGTPGWMAPEQAAGRTATPRTDLHAAARVVYEAATGRSWPVGSDPDRADWRGLPRRVAKALARGLAPDPDDRWADADAFRRALAAGGRSRRWPAAAAALLAVVLLAIVGVRSANGPAATASAPAYDLALLPCETVARGDSLVGDQVARVAALYLANLPRLRVVPHFRAFRWWRSTGRASEQPYRTAARELNAVHVARCTVEPAAGERLRVAVELADADGDVLPPQVVEARSATPPIEAGDALGLTIVRALRPRLLLSGEGHTALAGHDREAVRAFLLGEDAFQRDARRRAADYYEAALAIDSGLALARWRLVDLRRYLLAPAVEEDLAILAASAGPFGPVDRLMLDARLAPPGPERLARYRELLERTPEDPYALFTYGDELFHRGPLTGVGQDSALAVLRAAARRDPFLAPAHDHLAIALIRAGHREEAARAVDRLAELKGEDAERDLFHPEALRHAWDERYDKRRAAERRPVVFGEGALEAGLPAAARLSGPYLDAPFTEAALGAMLAARAVTRAGRASGRTAEGLGLLASGRFGDGLARLDRAAALVPGPEGRLHAALWRVLPSAMGLRGVGASGLDRGREVLAAIVADGTADALVRAQAAWGLALDAAARGDGDAERRWSRELASHEGAPGLERAAAVAAGWREAGRGEPEAALRLTTPVLSYREADRTEWPFLRAALYLGRGRWLAALGRPEEADRSLLWHEAVDLAGVPAGVAQAGEVDWALGAHADLLRARLHRDGGRPRDACRLADRVLRRWPAPDARLRGARDEAAAIRREACPA